MMDEQKWTRIIRNRHEGQWNSDRKKELKESESRRKIKVFVKTETSKCVTQLDILRFVTYGAVFF